MSRLIFSAVTSLDGTIEGPSTLRTQIERGSDPEAFRLWKAAADRDFTIGGPGLAGGIRLVLAPVLVGGGRRALPEGVRLEPELLEERRLAGGMVLIRYRSSLRS
jgi:hypothetical protein